MVQSLRGRVRRFQLDYENPLPVQLASRFTAAQLAIMSIIADAVELDGKYAGTHEELAEVAGTSIGAVRNALRLARKLELIDLQQVPNSEPRLIANTITIQSKDWQDWLKSNRRRPARKILLSLYIDEDVVRALRRQGPNWQEVVERTLRTIASGESAPESD